MDEVEVELIGDAACGGELNDGDGRVPGEYPEPGHADPRVLLGGGRVRRVGAVREQAVDVKVVAATQAELSARVAAGQFRADLYHRLAVLVLAVPPLHDRGEDIVLLAQEFL